MENPIPATEEAVPAHLVEALLGTLSLESVRSLVLFDRLGILQDAFPQGIGEELIPENEFALLEQGIPRGSFSIDTLVLTLPILRDDVDAESFHGVARYYMNPGTVSTELEGLDHQLFMAWLLLLCAGGGMIAWILTLTFRRLEKANLMLEERGGRLAAANQQLLLAAKTSAMGSLTANLMHGLKNPLTGLEEFVRGLQESGEAHDVGEIRLAVESARRMQDLIRDTLSVIQDEGAAMSFNYSLKELRTIVLQKLEPLALANQVRLQFGEVPDADLDSMKGNLLVLILYNLCQNAIEASTTGQEVAVLCRHAGESLEFRVHDSGSGLAESMRSNPFRPVHSLKPGGSGIGLALSHQLARQMDASLVLESSTAEGTCFVLSL